MNFKVGDMVRVVSGSLCITTPGTEGILMEVSDKYCMLKILKHDSPRLVGGIWPVFQEHLEKIGESKHSRKRHLLDAIQVEG